jgi:hypothetical protein
VKYEKRYAGGSSRAVARDDTLRAQPKPATARNADAA